MIRPILLVLSVVLLAGCSSTPPSSFAVVPVSQSDFDVSVSFVSGTEYTYGQEGQVIVEARYRDGSSAIANNTVFMVGNVSSVLYDNATVDRINDLFLSDLWVSYAGTTCIWRTSQDYLCGCAIYPCPNSIGHTQEVHTMRRLNATPGYQILGFQTDMSLGINGYCSGGNCWETDNWMWIGDYNSTFNKEGPYNGVTVYVSRLQVYRVINGVKTLIADAVDPISCGSIACNGFGTTPTRMYVESGYLKMVRNGVEIVNVAVNYTPNVNTVYGFTGSRIGSPYVHQASVIIVDNLYDIVNGTEIVEAVDCRASIWYPDKSKYINGTMMALGDNGNGFVKFTVPAVDGVYEYQAVCDIDGNNLVASKSFHVSAPVEFVKRIRAEVVK